MGIKNLTRINVDRRQFIGGSDARIIMGNDETRLLRLWREKRGEVEPEDLSQDLIVQLGSITEELNRTWYERNTGNAVEDIQRGVRHPIHKWMAATLDGRVQQTGAVFEAKFMLPWNFSEEAAAEKHMAQLQHNMWVTDARSAVLSIITGGGKWVEVKVNGDPLYQHLLLTAEKKFWRGVQNGSPLVFSALNRRGLAWRLFGLSIWARPTAGPKVLGFIDGPIPRTKSMRRPRPT
jgi:predicted phage-related endonuclease